MIEKGDTSSLVFCHGHMITYFVDRQTCDSMPASDVKSINENAYALSERGHIQRVEMTTDPQSIYVRSICLPEMRKDRIYKVSIVLDKDSNDILAGGCECPAGKAPIASCKHVAALCYTLDRFCKKRQIPGFLTCTDQLQSWNHPRPRKVKAIPVQQLKFQKLKYGKAAVKHTKPLSMVYDPRPPKFRNEDNEAVSQLYETLAQLGTPCGFLDLLRPVVDRACSVRHDHTYANTRDSPEPTPPRHTIVFPPDCETGPQPPTKGDMINFKQALTLTNPERKQLEIETRGQYNQPKWYDQRRCRLTASNCGKVLQRCTRAVAREILYPKPPSHLPAPLAWGRRYEPTARLLYEKVRSSEMGHLVTTQDCGLFVHPSEGWLAATPDAMVHFHKNPTPVGILEIKCPYVYRYDDIFAVAHTQESFFCQMSPDGTISLKRNHTYYDQVQQQLYVTSANWCDFCVYTTKGIAIESIYPDMEWKVRNLPKLQYFYDNILLPEILLPRMKPSYVL